MQQRLIANPLTASTQSQEAAIEHILNRLDRLEHESGQARLHPRFQFRRRGVPLVVVHPGGSQSTLSVWTRNISEGGMSIVLESFVHPGSHCRIDVAGATGQMQALFGEVRWCRLLTGNLHEFGMRFEEPVELPLFLSAATLAQAKAALDAVHDQPESPEAWSQAGKRMAEELTRLIERPNLNRAQEVCRALQDVAARMNSPILAAKASRALAALTGSASIARSESMLRELCEAARTLDADDHGI